MPISRTITALLFVLLNIFSLGSQAAPLLKVDITGVTGSQLQNVKLQLEIEQQKNNDNLSDQMIQVLHGKAAEQIQTALKPFGHYHVKVDGELQQTAQGWLARYRIDKGPPVRVNTVDIRVLGDGETNPLLQNQKNSFPVKEGETIRHQDYEKGKQDLMRVAYQNGYFDSRFTRRELRIDVDKNLAYIYLYFDTGTRYRFGDVEFQQTVYDESYLHRFLPFKEGDPFNEEELAELQFRLRDSNNFDVVQIDRPRAATQQDFRIPLSITLEPKKKHFYEIGLGYGTDTKFRTRFSWENRRLNSKGHRLRTDTRVGTEDLSELTTGEVSVKYTVPLTKPNTDKLDYISRVSQEKTDVVESITRELIAQRTYARWRQWSEVLSLRYLNGPFKVGFESDTTIKESTTLVIGGAAWSKLKSDDPIFPRRGYRFTVGLEGSKEDFLNTNASFVSVKMLLKGIKAFGRNVFIARLEGAYMTTSNFSQVHPDLRFFAGGDTSVRGFRYQSIDGFVDVPDLNDGVTLTDNERETIRAQLENTITRQIMEVGSLEYQFWFLPTWGVTLFTDAGFVETDADTSVLQVDKLRQAAHLVNDQPIRHSAGIGALWRSPVGPFSISFAQNLEDANISPRIHLSIGPSL